MAAPLRPPSPRPTLNVDAWNFLLRDPATGTVVGRPGPFGRGRVVSALRLGEFGNSQWHPLKPAKVVVDSWGFRLADVDGNLIGMPAVTVQRCLYATPTHETRHWGG